MASDNGQNGDEYTLDDFTLESILAEYKGSAFINGDKKTPTELLNEQTDRILKEALGATMPDAGAMPPDADMFQNDAGAMPPDADMFQNGAGAMPPDANMFQNGAGAEAFGNDTEHDRGDPAAAVTHAEAFGNDTEHGRADPAAAVTHIAGEGDARHARKSRNIDTSEVVTENREYQYAVEGGGTTQADRAQANAAQTSETRSNAAQTGTTQVDRAQTGGARSNAVQTDEAQTDGAQTNEAQANGAQTNRAQEFAATGAHESKNAAAEDKDNVILFFENYRSSEPEVRDTIMQDVEKAIERELGYGEAPDESELLSYGIYERSNAHQEELLPEDFEDEAIYEPDLKESIRRFAENLSSITFRVIPAAVLTLMMVILTLCAEAGLTIPFGIGTDRIYAIGALMILLAVVMALCADLVIRGAAFLLRGAPNAETLVLFSCLFSYISGAFSILRAETDILPYCAVSAVSLTFAALGERYGLRAITDTLKTATAATEPYGVQAEFNVDINKSVLKKAYNRVDGFYSNLVHPDVSETAYRYAAPILLVAALVFSVITVVAKGRGEYFLHILSSMLAAAAPFSLMLTFSLPFGVVARSIRKAGAAIAGWGGVDDICFSDGASVTDDDLFPPGTLSFNGVKIYEKIAPDKIIRNTASLIIASGSALAHIFAEVLRTQKMELVDVEGFTCYEGGIGAMINGEQVMTGSAAFMHLLGIRIPDDMNMKNAVFTAIDSKLIAMFSVEYLPINSVQSALISMLKWRIKLFFAMRDFNITPLMLEQKFRVSLEDIEYIQAKDSYTISDSYSGRQGRMAALLTREGLGPFAEAVTGGRLLKSSALVATVVSVVSAALGVLFMFFMCWRGAFMSAKPGNLMLFMFSTLAAVLVVCGYVKCKK
ncbi:MAG: hypothetical protein FWH33_05495 [Oscillospiraceae bacterium]|nr:hypothetical protein [Oscillospiraceae bacterium]